MPTQIEKKNNSGFWSTVSADFYAMEKCKLTILKFLKVMLIRPRFSAAFYFRCSSYLHKKGVIGKMLSRFFWLLNYYLNGCEIFSKAVVGGGLNLPHPHGVVIGMVNIGKNATILQNVTIGLGNFHEISFSYMTSDYFPTIGDDVIIGSGAAIIGSVTIGKGTIIGANAVVTKSIPAHCTAVGVPAKVIKHQKSSS